MDTPTTAQETTPAEYKEIARAAVAKVTATLISEHDALPEASGVAAIGTTRSILNVALNLLESHINDL